jgi:GNAT superfamily N-acetyltransferase
MITYTTSKTGVDLWGILDLQRANLPIALSPAEMQSQGFVTVIHSFEQLEKLNNIEHHVIGKEGDHVVAYLLAMTAESKNEIPVLTPMFEILDKMSWRGKPLKKYIVVGQVCVDKHYRGKGVLNDCYGAYKNQYRGKYDMAVTEIDGRNTRSLRAHEKIGFKQAGRYTAPNGIAWCVMVWDWM